MTKNRPPRSERHPYPAEKITGAKTTQVAPGQGTHKIRKLEKGKATLTAKRDKKHAVQTFLLFLAILRIYFVPHLARELSLMDVLSLLGTGRAVREILKQHDCVPLLMRQHLQFLHAATPFFPGDPVTFRSQHGWTAGTYLRNPHRDFQITYDVQVRAHEYRNLLRVELFPLPRFHYQYRSISFRCR
jgi:hypothetical protein